MFGVPTASWHHACMQLLRAELGVVVAVAVHVLAFTVLLKCRCVSFGFGQKVLAQIYTPCLRPRTGTSGQKLKTATLHYIPTPSTEAEGHTTPSWCEPRATPFRLKGKYTL